jgi:hypothetical protein
MGTASSRPTEYTQKGILQSLPPSTPPAAMKTVAAKVASMACMPRNMARRFPSK